MRLLLQLSDKIIKEMVFLLLLLLMLNSCNNFDRNKKESQNNKPNVILITSDQQRKGALEVYGNNLIQTPSLNSLAEDGIVFDRAYIPHPTCTPSRASILTGQYASKHGAYTIGTGLSEDALKLTDILTDNGYTTYAVGKMHFRPVSTEGEFESPPNILDEQFWKAFDGPFFGFQHVQLLNRHTTESLSCREHYGIWLKEKGLSEEDLSRYFNNQFIGKWELPRDLHPSVFVSEKSLDFLEEHRKIRKDKPFFMWMSFQDPHNPHVVPAPYDTLVDPMKVKYKKYIEGEFDNKPPIYQELYDKGMGGIHFSDGIGVPCASSAKPEKEDTWRKSIAIHHGMVQLMDEEIGKVINYLKDNDLYDNTIIIFTTDHGDYLGNHGFRGKGFPSFEEAYNIPFVIKSIENKNSGIRSSAIIGILDIAPTILDLIGISIPSEMDGISQKALILGETDKIRSSFIIENRAVEKGFYQKMIVSDRYKAVYYYGQEYGELYDLLADPDQYNNLWDKEEFLDLKKDMLFQLFEKNVREDGHDSSKYSLPELLKLLDEQIDKEGPVQKRTSFS